MDIVFTLTERLKVLMREHGVKAAPLARRATLNESAVRDILRGRSKNPGIVTLQKIASVLKLRPSALFEGGQAWPILGEVTAEGHVVEFQGEDAGKMGVENPFFYFREENFAALTENSGSIAPFAFDGDYLIFDRGRSDLRESDLGRPCICYLDDGRVLVRAPRLGDEPGRHHLTPVSMYGSAELNVKINRAHRVAMVLPAQFAPALPTATPVSLGDAAEAQSGVAKKKHA